MSEIDKALADLLKSALKKPAEDVGNILSDIINGTIGDRLREWKIRNLIEGLQPTVDLLNKMGIHPQKIKDLPMGEYYELFDSIAKIDDSSLRNKYSVLLANALDPSSTVSSIKIFTSVLNQLSPRDVGILDYIAYCESEDLKFNHWCKKQTPPANLKPNSTELEMNKFDEQSQIFRKKIDKQKDISEENVQKKFIQLGLEDEEGNKIAIQNLMRLSCISINVAPIKDSEFLSLVSNKIFKNHHDGTTLQLLDPEKTINAIKELYERTRLKFDEKNPSIEFQNIRRLRMGKYILCYNFTQFGRLLVDACSKNGDDYNTPSSPV